MVGNYSPDYEDHSAVELERQAWAGCFKIVGAIVLALVLLGWLIGRAF